MIELSEQERTSIGIYGNLKIKLEKDEAGDILYIGLFDSGMKRSSEVSLKQMIRKEDYTSLKTSIRLLYQTLLKTGYWHGSRIEKSGERTELKRTDYLETKETGKGKAVNVITNRQVGDNMRDEKLIEDGMYKLFVDSNSKRNQKQAGEKDAGKAGSEVKAGAGKERVSGTYGGSGKSGKSGRNGIHSG